MTYYLYHHLTPAGNVAFRLSDNKGFASNIVKRRTIVAEFQVETLDDAEAQADDWLDRHLGADGDSYFCDYCQVTHYGEPCEAQGRLANAYAESRRYDEEAFWEENGPGPHILMVRPASIARAPDSAAPDHNYDPRDLGECPF